MRILWLVAALAGCPRSGPPAYDPTLPEASSASASEPGARRPAAILADASADLDPSLRAAGLWHIVALGWGEDWDARALGDPSPWVQRVSASALARRADASAIRALQGFVAKHHRDPTARAIAALRAPQADLVAAIHAAWSEERSAWRRVPLSIALVALGDHDEARESLARSLRSGAMPLDVELVLEIGRANDHRLLKALRDGQRAVEEELALAIAAARLQLGDDTAEEPFRRALSSADVQERLEALDVLVQLDHDRVSGLLERARGAGPAVVAWYAGLALAAGRGTDPKAFLSAASDEDPEVRELAVRFAARAASGASPNRRVVRVARSLIADALRDPDLRVQTAALRAAREARVTEAAGAARALLRHDSPAVRVQAAGAVLALTDGASDHPSAAGEVRPPAAPAAP